MEVSTSFAPHMSAQTTQQTVSGEEISPANKSLQDGTSRSMTQSGVHDSDSQPTIVESIAIPATTRRGNIAQKITAAVKSRENRKLAACYWALGAAGWNDASLGPLIPYIESYFTINYTIVSTMFISSCVGYFFAGTMNNRFTDRFGMGKVITVGAACQMIGYAVCIAPPPFPVMPCVYVLVGLGVAFQDAGANAWVAGLPDASTKLGYLHGAYGLGGLVSPLVATAFVQAGVRWSFFFSVSLALAFINVVVLYLTFWLDNAPMDHENDRPARKSELPGPGSQAPNSQSSNNNATAMSSHDQDIELTRIDRTHDEEGRVHQSMTEADLATGGAAGAPALAANAEDVIHRTTAMKDKEVFSSRIVWLCAGFLLLYVGAEVSIGGWVVSFLLDERNGPVSAGYVSSGFWGGITLGRVLLPKFNVWFGERNVVFIYIVLALALEFVIWFVRDLISNAVAVSFVGFVLGPFFPIAISVAGKLLPRYLHTGAIGLMAAIGSAGAAIFPFVTGTLAQKYGTWVLQPMIVSLLVGMGALWAFVPSPARRKE